MRDNGRQQQERGRTTAAVAAETTKRIEASPTSPSSATVVAATTADDAKQEHAGAGAAANKPAVDHNPRWKGYVYILFASLVCFASVSQIEHKRKGYSISITIGAFTFMMSMIILILDRFQSCFAESFRFHKYKDGKFEGLTLIFFVLWWVAGVWFMTNAGGIAYKALNIYFSSWLSLAACCYTLNEWSGSKDIITIQELTSVSSTLRGWYTNTFSSLVVMGSAAELHAALDKDLAVSAQASFGAALGIMSCVVSGIFILAHYRILSYPKVGGWTELTVTFFMILFWIVGVGVLTQDEGVAASLTGYCPVEGENKALMVQGSNLYFFSWLSLMSVIDIALQWKAKQAMTFAHASSSKGKRSKTARKSNNGNTAADDVDDHDDDDDDDEV